MSVILNISKNNQKMYQLEDNEFGNFVCLISLRSTAIAVLLTQSRDSGRA